MSYILSSMAFTNLYLGMATSPCPCRQIAVGIYFCVAAHFITVFFVLIIFCINTIGNTKNNKHLNA